MKSTMRTSSPSPVLQKINHALHTEPLSTVTYGFYWSFILLVIIPLSGLVVQVQMVLNLIIWWLGRSGNKYFEPSANKGMEMAVVITGCDTGIGKELAFWAADAGYQVFACCLNKSSFGQFEILDKIVPLKLDVTNNNEVKAAVDIVSKWLQESVSKKRVLHALINNAGIGCIGDIDWLDLSDYQKVMDVNYFGIIRCCKGFLPLLKSQSVNGIHKYARILNIVSMAGLSPPAVGLSAYSASKHAANSFSTALRLELKAFGIQVSTINPSFHGTPLVFSMHDGVTNKVDALPKETKEEYGQDYFKRFQELSVDLPHSLMWNVEVVIERVMDCLKCKVVPSELIIGSDARFVLLLLRMVPAWCIDLFNLRPIPASMKQKSS